MRFTVVYKTPEHKKEQRATFLNIEDSFKWETYVKENLSAYDLKIIPSQENSFMVSTLLKTTIRIIDVDIILEEDGYYSVVTYSDGKFDEFGPYDSYQDAESTIY